VTSRIPSPANIFASNPLQVPYGVTARRNGCLYQFSRGSLAWADPSRVKLLIQHDRSQAIGRAVSMDDRPEGLFATFQVVRTPEGDRALVLAEDGVYHGLAIGLTDQAQFSTCGGVWHSGEGTPWWRSR
jgi:phage head maturation protease